MKDAQENALTPIDVPFGGHNFIARLVPQTDTPVSINTRLFLIRQWLELGQGMFALQVRQLNSSTRQDSFYLEGPLICFATRHYLGAKRHLHPDCGTADDCPVFSDPPQAPKRAFKHANESTDAYDLQTEHQSFAVQ